MIKINKKDLNFRTDKESLQYFIEIVEIMMKRFGLPKQEAIGRINKSWNHVEEVVGDDWIYREFPFYWANHFYFGKESFWWIENVEERVSKGLSVLKPLFYEKKDL